MNENQHDEIDLLYAIGKLKQIIKNWITLAFSGLYFVLKLWYVVVALIILGLGLAWFKTDEIGPTHESTMIVKVNYGFQSYAMNALENFNREVYDRDPEVLTFFEFESEHPRVYKVDVEPIIDFKDILDDYEVNDRGLEILLRTVDFNDEEVAVKDYFEPKYNLYELNFSTNKNASVADIEKFFEYVNENEKLQAYKTQVETNMQFNIEENMKSIGLINKLLESYADTEQVANPTIDFNPNANGLLEAKTELQKEISDMKAERILAEEIIYPLSEVHIVKKQQGITANKKIMYPLLLVFLFLFVSYLRYLFFYFRKIARENQSQ